MERETKLGRPKTVKNGQKLNLYVDREVKRTLFTIATDQQKSISAVVRELVLAEAGRRGISNQPILEAA